MSSRRSTPRARAGSKPNRGRALTPLLVVAVVAVSLAGAQAAEQPTSRVVAQGVEAFDPVTPVHFKGDLRDLPRADAWQSGDPERELHRLTGPTSIDLGSGSAPRPLWGVGPLAERQRRAEPGQNKDLSWPVLNIAGQGYTGSTPPDAVGDVGPSHYIQAVHGSGANGAAEFAIYDKAGNQLVGPSRMDSIPTAGNCQGTGSGSPMVLYDRDADQWLMAEVAWYGSDYSMCVYVSETSDPTGPWYVYDFPRGTTRPDYAHYGVWPEAYYVTTYEPGDPPIYALRRSEMLAGDPAVWQRLTVPKLPGFGFQALTPADLDGAVLPPSDPGIVARHYDDEQPGGSANAGEDYIDIYEVSIDWDDPPSSKVTAVGPGDGPIVIGEFNSQFLDYTTYQAIPQPDSPPTGALLDPMREVMMHRLAYRNMGTHEALVGNFVTNQEDVDSGKVSAAVRWFELRRSGGLWDLYQEGTFGNLANLDENRWIGAIAMDQAGNIALGYNFTDVGGVYPSLFYTGRTASDPLGDMGPNEYVAGWGTKSQSSWPWGWYAAMSVDPVDDCTFWLTGEYCVPDLFGGDEWRTRIVAFSFDNPSSVDVAPNGSPDSPYVACVGSSVVLTATTTGGSNLTYAWTENGSLIGTQSWVSVAKNSGTYFYNCEVTGPSCSQGLDDPDDTYITWQDEPLFGGARWVTATSATGCNQRIEWDPGTGCNGKSSVVYNVYKSIVPNPAIILSNPIATCVGNTFFDDTPVNLGDNFYYIVRAEDSRVGYGGPCNGGLEDSNVVIRRAIWEDHVDYGSWQDAEDNGGWQRGLDAGTEHWDVQGNAFITHTEDDVCDKYLISPELRIGPTSELSFDHSYDFWESADGGVLEIDTGSGWEYIPDARITAGNYDGTIYEASNPLDGMEAWTTPQASATVTVDLASYSWEVARIRWRMGCDDSPDGGGWEWLIDDIALDSTVAASCVTNPPPDPLPFHTGRAGKVEVLPGVWVKQVRLEWVNPYDFPLGQGNWDVTRICWSTSGFPSDPEACDEYVDCDAAGCGQSTGLGMYDYYLHQGLFSDVIYYYSGWAGYMPQETMLWSSSNSFMAYPSDAIGPPETVNWGSHHGASNLTPVGLGSLFAISNTQGIFSLDWGPDGGSWITGSLPLAISAPGQSRPPVINFSDDPVITDEGLPSEVEHYKVVFVGQQDGYVLAMDGLTGAEIWTSADLGTLLAAPAGVFTDLGGSFNRLLIGTRNAAQANQIVALDSHNVVTPNPAAWTFDNGATITPCTASTDHCIGIISGTATWSEDTAYHLYFASREYDSSNNGTLWCIDFTAAGASLCNSGVGWPVALGDIDGSPILEGGHVFVGNNTGIVYKVNATNGATVWSSSAITAGDGAVKGYVSPDPGSNAIFLATTNTIWSLNDNGGTVSLDWSDNTTISSPSVPLFAPHTSDYLYIGTGDGSVYQVNVSGPVPAFTEQELGLAFSTSSAVGQPALDVVNEMIYVGTEAGALYSADVPFLESKAHAPE